MKRLAVYLAVTFGLTWGVVIPAGVALGAFEYGEAAVPAMVGTHLIIGEVARMVTESTGGGMTAHDGLLADIEGIVEALLASMAHIDEDAQTVHLGNDLCAKLTHATMRLIAL